MIKAAAYAARMLSETDRRLSSCIENLKKRRTDIDRYAHIMENVYTADILSDTGFQKEFTYFYRIRRDSRWRQEYYRLFSECRDKEDLSFGAIIEELYRRTGRIEASFSSKLLSALDSNMPIWDSIVLSKLHIKPALSQDKKKRIQDAIRIYDEIVCWYQGFLQSDGAKEYLDAFDRAFPEYTGFSSVKKIDFILWGSKDVDPLPGKIIEINGCVEVPFPVTEDEFMDKFLAFIEENHWYFGGGIRLTKEK